MTSLCPFWFHTLEYEDISAGAAARGMNRVVFRHSARTLPLKESAKALSVGLPGRLRSRVTTRLTSTSSWSRLAPWPKPQSVKF